MFRVNCCKGVMFNSKRLLFVAIVAFAMMTSVLSQDENKINFVGQFINDHGDFVIPTNPDFAELNEEGVKDCSSGRKCGLGLVWSSARCECRPCEKGEYWLQDQCNTCPHGTYQGKFSTRVGKSSCTPCPNTTSNDGNIPKACEHVLLGSGEIPDVHIEAARVGDGLSSRSNIPNERDNISHRKRSSNTEGDMKFFIITRAGISLGLILFITGLIVVVIYSVKWRKSVSDVRMAIETKTNPNMPHKMNPMLDLDVLQDLLEQGMVPPLTRHEQRLVRRGGAELLTRPEARRLAGIPPMKRPEVTLLTANENEPEDYCWVCSTRRMEDHPASEYFYGPYYMHK